MGLAMEMISFKAVDAALPGITATALPGDSLQVRNANIEKSSRMIQMWAGSPATGIQQITSSFLHDTTRGINYFVTGNETDPLFSFGTYQRLKPQDTLIPLMGNAIGVGSTQHGFILNWYEDLPGIDALLFNYSQIIDKILNLTTVSCSITADASGNYSGSEAINAESDLLHANTYYAILGVTSQDQARAIGIRGPDFGNMRVGIPVNNNDYLITNNWFADLSVRLGLPTIPVFNSANKGGTFIDVVQDPGIVGNVDVSLILAELGTSLPTAS